MCACVCSLLFDLQVRNAAALSVKSAVAHSQRSLEPRVIRDPLLVRSPEHHITRHTNLHRQWIQTAQIWNNRTNISLLHLLAAVS